MLGQTFVFEVFGKTDAGPVWGGGVYTDDSSLAAAAVHAGALRKGQKGVVQVTILKGERSYKGWKSNDVTSEDWGEHPGSYRIDSAARPERPDPGALNGVSAEVGQTFVFEVVGSTNGVIYGSGVYTDDSTLATAAVHAGVLKNGQKGKVRVTILPGEKSYKSTTNNGVTSVAWNEYGRSYHVEAVKD
jgi:hypothetical protein